MCRGLPGRTARCELMTLGNFAKSHDPTYDEQGNERAARHPSPTLRLLPVIRGSHQFQACFDGKRASHEDTLPGVSRHHRTGKSTTRRVNAAFRSNVETARQRRVQRAPFVISRRSTKSRRCWNKCRAIVF